MLYSIIMYRPKRCERCGKEFIPRSSRSKVCDNCKVRKCEYCGKKFVVTDVGRLLRGWSKYCSCECYLKARWNKSHKKVFKCKNCGKEFVDYESNKRIFCSKKCQYKWMEKFYRASEETRRKQSLARKGKRPKNIEIIIEHSRKKKGKKIEEIYGEEKAKKIKKKLKKFRKTQEIPIRPTKPEKMFIDICNKFKLPYKYVGNGQIWLSNKNPDFIHKNKKIVVEIFGKYWHKEEEVKEYKKYYKKFGWECVVFWDYEINFDNIEAIKEKLAEVEKNAKFRNEKTG